MKLCLIFASALIIGALAVPTPLAPSDALLAHERENEAHFQSWKAEHGKEYYTQEEHDSRLQIFSENKAIVEQHNSEGHSWTLHLNKFADMTASEFASRHGFMGHMSTTGTDDSTAPERHNITGEAPTTMDWRQHNLVNPIKNQEQCGSCWAFSTVDSYESAVAKKTGKLVSFSEQDLVDCCKDVKVPGTAQTCCNGCQGGLMDFGFQYLMDKQNGEDTTEASYPYKAKQGTCDLSGKSKSGAAAISSFKDIAQGDEDALVDACGTQGVISVAVNAGTSGWQLYKEGVFDPWFCDGQKLDHGVAVVGFGTDGKDYWILRNSWGTVWGEEGYMRIRRGKNTCGIANSASYPVV